MKPALLALLAVAMPSLAAASPADLHFNCRRDVKASGVSLEWDFVVDPAAKTVRTPRGYDFKVSLFGETTITFAESDASYRLYRATGQLLVRDAGGPVEAQCTLGSGSGS